MSNYNTIKKKVPVKVRIRHQKKQLIIKPGEIRKAFTEKVTI